MGRFLQRMMTDIPDREIAARARCPVNFSQGGAGLNARPVAAGKVWGRCLDRTPRRGPAAAGNRRTTARRYPLLPKLAAFTSEDRDNDEKSLTGYCKGGIDPVLRTAGGSQRSAQPLSGLRIQSLTKAPRTPVLQDFRGVKKSGRFTRITSSQKILLDNKRESAENQ
jgi:hypothetical protein